jgi:hypothetical protein
VTGAIVFGIPAAVVGLAVVRRMEAVPHWAWMSTRAVVVPLVVGIGPIQASRRRHRLREAAGGH